jgi:arylsulfatase A-like enzyme
MAPPPNILIVCTDQQRTDSLGCYGSDVVETPGFDYVAARGTCYTRAYCPSAVCTPSRVSLLTGQYVARHGVWNVGVNAGADVDFLSHRLGRAGYQTCLVGKAHFEAYGAGADESCESIAGYGAGYGEWTGPYYGFETAKLALGHTVWGMAGHYGAWLRERATAQEMADFEKLRPADGFREFGGNAYDWSLPTRLSNSVWTIDTAIDFLERQRDPTRPFHLFVSFQDPHHPHAVPNDFAGRVDPNTVGLPRHDPDELDRMPPHFRLAHEGRLKGSPYARRWPVSGQHDGFDYRDIPEASQRLARSYYYSLVKLIDDQLLRLWACLENAGLLENTLVVVTSDHGELLGDHGLWMKGPFHYQELARVPLLVMGPGIAAGTVEDGVVSLVDVAPTVLALAGLQPETEMDGIDLAHQPPPDRTVLCETVLDWEGLICRTVVGRRHKLTWYANSPHGELFDLEADPEERNNLWADPAAGTVRADLLGRLIDHDTRMQASTKQRIAYA